MCIDACVVAVLPGCANPFAIIHRYSALGVVSLTDAAKVGVWSNQDAHFVLNDLLGDMWPPSEAPSQECTLTGVLGMNTGPHEPVFSPSTVLHTPVGLLHVTQVLRCKLQAWHVGQDNDAVRIT
jgi:hypothetical protein